MSTSLGSRVLEFRYLGLGHFRFRVFRVRVGRGFKVFRVGGV